MLFERPIQPLTEEPSPAGRDHLRRGFAWLGAASAVARVLDAISVLVVLVFVSRAELGLATLAWSVAVFLESMNGLGIGTALLQAREVDGPRLCAAFWYVMGLATLLVVGVAGASPWIAAWFHEPSLAPMIAVSSTKLLTVGAALVPLTLLNRAMKFERIAAVSTVATLASGLVTCGLAALDYGAWALVIGQWTHGAFTLLGVQWAQPFWPRGKPRFALLRADAIFGAKVAASSALYHFYRNADYYVLGRVLGVGAVGLYRVAFDLAMAPTAAVLNVVNRTALPVYARLSERPGEAKDAFLWTLHSLGLLTAPVTAFLFFAAEDLLRWVDAGRWLAAVPIVRWLALAALVRCVAQTFPQLFHAMRRPVFAIYDSLFTMVLLLGSLSLLLHGWGSSHGAVVAAWSWAFVYPVALVLSFALARLLVPLSLWDLVVSLRHTFGSLACMAVPGTLFELFLRQRLPAWSCPFLLSALLVVFYAAYVRVFLRFSLRGLLSAARSRG